MASATVDHVFFWKKPEWPWRQTKTTCTLPLHPLSGNKEFALASHRRQNYQIHLDYKMKNKKKQITRRPRPISVHTFVNPWINSKFRTNFQATCLQAWKIFLDVSSFSWQSDVPSCRASNIPNKPHKEGWLQAGLTKKAVESMSKWTF